MVIDVGVSHKMADDADLEAIRARRMAELQAQYGGKEGNQAEKAEEQRRQTEMMNAMLSQILSQEARARLNSIALVKPDKAKAIEQLLIRMAQSGQLHGKLGEEELKKLLVQVTDGAKKTSVKFDRRRVDFDSDSD